MDSPSEKLENVVASLPQGDSFRKGAWLPVFLTL